MAQHVGYFGPAGTYTEEAASRYAVRAVPTLVVLDADSKPIYRRTGMPDRAEVVARIAGP